MEKDGKEIIEALNKEFGVNIPITDETTLKIIKVIDGIGGMGYCEDCDKPDCDNCDERRGEPMINEGYY